MQVRRTEFGPGRDERSFAVIASDYTMLTFLTPLVARLEEEGPDVRLWVSPPGDDYVDRLARGRVDLVIVPREVFAPYREFPHQYLFQDRLAWFLADQTSLRLIEPPIPLQPIHQLMLWANRTGHDPGHQWLRQRIAGFAHERDELRKSVPC
jgi:DNA-binding transcriptional LysR family regulator